MAWILAAHIADLSDRNVLGLLLKDKNIAIYRLPDGIFATDNICTHQHAYMSDGYIDGDCVECPLHQALFNIRTGIVVAGPAKKPLPVYHVKLEGDSIYIDL